MARPKKPAATTQGHGTSKTELQQRMAMEKEMQGETDDLTKVPDSIKNDNLASKYYLYLVKILTESDILSNLDRINLSLMAIDLAQMNRLNDIINDGHLIVEQETKNGVIQKPNPAISAYKGYVDHFGKMSTQFGLSPSARAQLSSVALEQRAADNDPVANIIQDN